MARHRAGGLSRSSLARLCPTKVVAPVSASSTWVRLRLREATSAKLQAPFSPATWVKPLRTFLYWGHSFAHWSRRAGLT